MGAGRSGRGRPAPGRAPRSGFRVGRGKPRAPLDRRTRLRRRVDTRRAMPPRRKDRRATRRLHRLGRRESALRSSSRSSRARCAVAQRSEATDQRNRAQAQERSQRPPRSKPPRRHARQPWDDWRSRPGHSPRRILRRRLLLALEADRLLPDDDTLGSLEVALLANPTLLRSVHTTPLLNVVFSPDGTEVSGGTSDGRLVEIDTSTGATVHEWQAR